jgi:hypothetical protein
MLEEVKHGGKNEVCLRGITSSIIFAMYESGKERQGVSTPGAVDPPIGALLVERYRHNLQLAGKDPSEVGTITAASERTAKLV